MVPVVIAADKTELPVFVGSELIKAYPVYMTILNIDNHIRTQPTRKTIVLVAYLPTTLYDTDRLTTLVARNARLRLIHKILGHIFKNIREASLTGMDLVNTKGEVRHGYPVLAIDAVDYPERCAHCAVRFGQTCPKCNITKEQLGAGIIGELRTGVQTLQRIEEAARIHSSANAIDAALKEHGLNYVPRPFWRGWRGDIHKAQCPDRLHEGDAGIEAHLTKWNIACLGEDEIDARFKCMPLAFRLRHFKSGITNLGRTSGTEHRAIASQMLGCLSGSSVPKGVIRATRALFDFAFISQFRCHSDETLADLDRCARDFDTHKEVYLNRGWCECMHYF